MVALHVAGGLPSHSALNRWTQLARQGATARVTAVSPRVPSAVPGGMDSAQSQREGDRRDGTPAAEEV